MPINQIIIFGSTGMLGRYVTRYLTEQYQGTETQVIPLDRSKYNILTQSFQELDELLNTYITISSHGINTVGAGVPRNLHTPPGVGLECNVNGTCIINCAGLIPQRLTQSHNKNKANYYLVNSIFPQMLDQLANKYRARLIHITTDCVYHGIIKSYPATYTEMDPPDEQDNYGHSKLLGENLSPNTTIIRTSIIGDELTPTGVSFLSWVKNSAGIISGWDNHYWNGITCYQLAVIIWQIIQRDLFWPGIKHIYSPEIVSKYQLALIIKEVYNLDDLVINRVTQSTSINKALGSIYPNTCNQFSIPDLKTQLLAQAQFDAELT